MKKRLILYLLPLLFFFLSAFMLYENEKRSVSGIINNNFLRELPHFSDSIIWIQQKFIYFTRYDNEWYKRRRETDIPHKYIMENPSNRKLIDTIYISPKYLYSPNVLQYDKKVSNSISLAYQERLHLNIRDSLWNQSLKRANIDAETSIIVGLRQLKDMFPAKDSFNAEAPVTSDTSRFIDFNSAFCTDSVILGVQNQATFRGYAHVSPLAVIRRLVVPYSFMALFVMFYLLLPPFLWLRKVVGYRHRCVRFVGDAMLHLLDNEIVCNDGSRKRLGVNEFAILCKLVAGRRLLLNEMQDELWPASDAVARGRSFNVSFSKLNSVLKDVERITLLRDEASVELIDSTTLRERLSQYVQFVRMYVRRDI